MKNIFTKTFMLFTLLSLSAGLWGETQIAILNFVYTQVGSENQDYNICGYFDKDKIILDSDFGWNTGKDNVCNSSNAGEIDDYIMLKNAAVACSRKNYTFGGGNLTLTLDTKCTDHNTYTGPTVTIDGKSASFGSITYNNDKEQKTVSVTLEKVSAGTHDISVSFTGSDKFYVKTLTITEAGGPTPSTKKLYLDCSQNTGWPGSAYLCVWDGSNDCEFTQVTDCSSPSNLYVAEISSTATTVYIKRCEGSNHSNVWNQIGGTGDGAQGFTPGTHNCCQVSSSNWNEGSATDYTPSFTVTFNKKGKGPNIASQCVQSGSTATNPNTKAIGFTCKWYKEETFENEWNFSSDKVSEDITLYAKWTATENKTIYLNPLFNSGGAQDWRTNEAVIFAHAFVGAGNSAYQETFDAKMVKVNDCDAEIKCDIPVNTEKIIFVRDKNGTSTIDWSDDGKWNATAEVNFSSTYDKYQITGWNTASTATSNFSAVKYTITFAGNGNTSGSMSDVNNIACGGSTTLIANAYKKTDYKFIKWKDQDNNEYADQATISNITKNLTLTAQWQQVVKYTITATSADPTKGSVTGGGTYDEGATVTLTATPENGNEFVEWSDHNTDNPRVFTASTNLTLTATFQKVCNKLMIECETFNNYPAPTKGQSRDGVEFNTGWYTGYTGTGFADFRGNTAEIYFPVHLPAANYTFEFSLRNGNNKYFNLYQKSDGSGELTIDGVNYAKINGGERLSSTEDSGGNGDPFVTEYKSIDNVTDDDYVIGLYGKGWASFDHILITASSDVFCPATWSVYGNFDGGWKDYEMTDGVITIPNISRASNYQFKLRKTSDEGENYTYYGAQNQENNMTSSNCTNWTLTNTNDGYDINITTGATGSYTFTATDLTGDSPNLSVTYPTAYSITFDDNDADGGTDMTNITNIASGGSETLPTMTRTKAGYRFTGWKDASGNDYADGATIENITSNITLTAQWETVVTVVTVTAEGGVNEIMEGNTLQMSVAYTPADAAYGRSVTWSSSNTNLATISNEGLVSALQPGSVTITATSLNGVQGNYPLTIVASACGEGVWKMTYWPQGSGNKSEYCFTQIGETHEWRRDYTLPSVADWFSIGQVGGANDHSKDWTFNALTTIGLQSNKDATKYYPGQDAVGYLRIFDNSTDANYYVAFEPIYQALFGIENGSDPWTVLDFEKVANTDHEYETSTFQVPAGYKTNDNYKYYVGTKRANGTSQFVSGKSNSDKLNTVSGLKDSDMSGKYGKFHIWDNSADNNWYCEFIRYYRLAYSGEGTEGYNPHDVLNTGSSSDRTVILGNVPAKTGYNISGWTIGGVLHPQGSSYEITDDATAVATWTPIVYNITYNNVEGATNTNPATYTIEDEIVLEDASRTGYDFAGWYLDAQFTNQITQISAGSHEDKTLYAKWTPTEYTITYYNLEGATNPNPANYTIETTTINLQNPGTRAHYTFDGWFSDAQLETPVTTIAQGSTGDKVLYAKWTEDSKYTITFDATTNGGTCATASKDIYVGDAVGTLPEATRDDYNMTGWFDAATGGNQITESTIPTGNVTYYAQFAVAPLVECTKHRKLECEDAMIPYDKLTIFNSSVAGPKTATFGNNDTHGEYSGRGYMLTVHDDAGSQIYIPLSISGEEQAALTMQICYANSQHDYSKIRIYKETQESGDIKVTNTGKYYSRIYSEEFASSGWTTDFTTANYNKTLDPGNYIIGLWAKNDARFDYIDISTTYDVLCTTTPRYELKLEINDPEKGENATGAGAYTAGALAPINVTAKSGYEVVAWKKGETLVSTEASFNYTMPAENVTLTAYFDTKATKRTLTASVADGQSSWGHVDQTSQQVGEGRPAQVTAIVDNDQYRFDHWSSTDVDLTELQAKANPLNFTMPTKDVAVVAHFVFDDVHNLIATGTSTNVGTHINRHSNLDRITITSITDNTGSFQHNVLQYAINFQSTSDYSAYTVPTDANYSANSKATGYAFWYMADDNIYMEFNVGGEHGIVCNLPSTDGAWKYFYVEDATAATATSGFEIWMNYEKNGWGMSSLTGTVLFSEIQATNVTSQEPIVPKVNLTVEKNPDEGGNVTTSPAEITNLEKGTPVTLTATPNTGYRFVNWTVNDVEVSTEATYSRIVNATETITANFERVYTLTINNDGNGTATVSPNQTKFAEGEKFTLTAQPTAGYAFDYYMDGGNKIETDPYEFTMSNSDRTISVNFKKSINYYDINTSVSGEGIVTIKVDGETHTGQQILEGTQVTLTATPNSESYAFTQWQDGNTDNPRTIIANAVNADITWTATFAQVYTVSVELGKPGKEVIGVGKYAGGAQVTLTAVANTKDSQDKTYDLEYQLKEWTAMSGISITGHEYDNPLTFGMPYKDVSLKATFAPVECVDSLIIQCEDINAFIPATAQGEAHDLPLAPHHIPDKDGCGTKTDYYYGWHGDGYYDYRNNTNCEMYYPVFLQAGTYQFSVWAATDENKNCSINIYKRTDGTPVLTYKAVDYSRIATAAANNSYKKEGENYVTFQEVGIIQNVVVETEQLIIVGLHCGNNYGTFDQIKIKGTTKVFCAPLPTTDFVINAGETKEIPVCGVDNLTIYDGGQANNNDDVEVFKQVKYSRTVKELDKWETFAVPYNANDITVQDIPHKDFTEYVINPIYGEEGKYTAGYFYMEELKGEDATLMGRPFASRWEISLTQYPQQNVPYIIRFPREQSNGYFANTQINYKYDYTRAGGASVILTGKKNATIIEEDYLGLEEKPTFYFYANNTLADIQLQTSAYILNESGMNFDIVDQPVIPPFHCYIQAIQEIKQLYPHLVMRNDGGGTTILIPMRADELDSLNAKKVMIDEVIYIVREGKIYTVMGQLVK